jgi:hypothetical protein
MPKKREQSPDLKLVFIRHAEKPVEGNNLSCQGINRAMKLPAVLYEKFGRPQWLLVPSVDLGVTTTTARMFQTITPFAVKYNLSINTKFLVENKKKVAKYLLKRKGTVIITWEHNMIPKIVQALGINGNLDWPGEDYDSIWIVTFNDGQPELAMDQQGLAPKDVCRF